MKIQIDAESWWAILGVERVKDNTYKVDLPGEYNVSA